MRTLPPLWNEWYKTRPVGQARLTMLFERGLQTDGELEAGFGAALAQLPRP